MDYINLIKAIAAVATTIGDSVMIVIAE